MYDQLRNKRYALLQKRMFAAAEQRAEMPSRNNTSRGNKRSGAAKKHSNGKAVVARSGAQQVRQPSS